jgi:heme oxygenase
MFSDKLREGTKRAHLGLEKKLIDKIRQVRTVTDYIQLLEVMYGYYQPLQLRIVQNVGRQDELNRARQSQNIINDIKELDPEHSMEFRLCNNLPEISSRAASLGALYVTEGSTLGGQIICKMISKQLNLSTDKGFSFFNAYGDQTKLMWEEFKTILDKPGTAEERDQTMASAVHTFEKFNEWIELYE